MTVVPKMVRRRASLGVEGPIGVLVACLVGTVATSSYNMMVAVALPEIGRAFDADLSLVQWVTIVYFLVTSSTVAISGRVGDLVGARLVYRLGLLGFGLGTTACAVVDSLPALLVARAAQALGAGMYVVSVPSILAETFPHRQRGRVIGLYSGAAYVGLSIGPIIGGALTQFVGWRGVFLLGAPVALLSLWLAWRHLPLQADSKRTVSFDVAGSLVYVVAFVPMLLALNNLGAGNAWLVVALFAIAAVAVGLFIYLERRSDAPLIDLSLFSSRYFGLSAVATLLQYVALQSVFFLVPFYVIQFRDSAPALAGLVMSALPISMMAASPVVGALSDRLGPRVPATVGVAVLAGGLLLLAQAGLETPYVLVALMLVVAGAGAAFGDVANSTALLGGVPPERRGMASATMVTSRHIGHVLGVALATTAFVLTVGGQVSSASGPGFVSAFLFMAVLALLSVAASALRGDEPVFHRLARERQAD